MGWLKKMSIGRFIFQTLFSRRQVFTREPEPHLVMSDPEQVSAFDEEGTELLTPLYLFNAEAMSSLLPQNGTLLDLGCGSGRLLKALASIRPDAKIIGVDYSEQMLELARNELNKSGLGDRVQLIQADMSQIDQLISRRVDLISSVFSLHHLPNEKILNACLGSIARIRNQYGSAIWIFDHTPPKSKKLASRFPEVFSPNASNVFKRDSKNSLLASFEPIEIAGGLAAATANEAICITTETPRLLPFYQVHWVRPLNDQFQQLHPEVKINNFKAHHVQEFKQFKALWKNLPQGRPKPNSRRPEAEL